MKNTLCCIKCGHRRLWVIDHVEQPTHNDFSTVTFHATSITKPDSRRCYSYGRFQSIICAQCGYTEWYAYQLERLHELLADPTSGVRLVSSEPGSAGPFR